MVLGLAFCTAVHEVQELFKGVAGSTDTTEGPWEGSGRGDVVIGGCKPAPGHRAEAAGTGIHCEGLSVWH